MDELLKLAVDAHGGLAKWHGLTTLSASLTIRGKLFDDKRQRDRFERIALSIDLHQSKLTMESVADDWRSEYTASNITLSHCDGTMLDSQVFPRQAFKASAMGPYWNDLQAAFICSFALQSYSTIPFLYTEPGFSLEELPVWREDGLVLRRLKVIFPESPDNVRREHIAYFDHRGVLFRLDCTNAAGGELRGATYAYHYQEISGVIVPFSRRVFGFDMHRERVEPLLAEVTLSDVRLV